MRQYNCELYIKDTNMYSEKFLEVAALQDCYIEIGDVQILDVEEEIKFEDFNVIIGLMFGIVLIWLLFLTYMSFKKGA